jgi:hypothetical protein
MHPDVAWLLTLRATERARFLALVAHELTVWGRVLARSALVADTPTEMRQRVEQLRQLNEIQHRVCNYIGYALGPNEDVVWLPIVARYVLAPSDPWLRRHTTQEWAMARRSFVAVP